MADLAAITSIAKSALQLFTSLAKDKSLIWNSEKELQRLMDTFDIICCLLRDADKMQSTPEAVQKCLSRLRVKMYDVEDLFDELAAIVLHKRTTSGNAFTKEVRLFFSKSNQLGLLYKITHEVKSLRESLDRIKQDMDMCGFVRQQPHVAQPFMKVDRNKTQSSVNEEDVIGRDQERNCIIDTLLPGDKGETSYDRSLPVVAIIGFGGLGKTTLAQYVYNDERVKQGFDERLWACINDLSNPEQVLIEIIASKEGRQPNRGLEMLKDDFRRIIGGKKFLLVLDDVWDVDFKNWHDLEPILRCGRSGSKVLVTTRSKKVAECLNAAKPYCFDLDVLSEESAWSLFVKKADCEVEVSEHPELERLGKKILHRCGNVPLAIVMVGSLLAHRETEERVWSKFLYEELEKALSNDLDIKKVLMFSYNDLHPNLKLCFAYCALFPKDTVFDKDELVCLWLAQGFIKPFADNGQSLEEEGEAYFNHLVKRCFFQEVKEYERWEQHSEYVSRGVSEYRHTAKMHDLLHDVAISVAETESCFIDKGFVNKSKMHNLRHIFIDSKADDSFYHWSMVSDSKTLRTLVFYPCVKQIIFDSLGPDMAMAKFRHFGNQINNKFLDMLLTRFRMLRTLSLSNLGIDHVSDSIGELIHLRHLDLSRNEKLKHLPKSICELHHLMLFELMGCKLLEKLPPRIEKLVSLRQLHIGGCKKLDSFPPGLKALTLLVNLDRVIVHRRNGGLGYLKELDNLGGSVEIELPREGWPDAIEDAKKACMWKKHKINGMDINWEGNSTGAHKLGKDEARAVMEALQPYGSLQHLSIRNYDGEMISGWLCTLKNLRALHLYGCDQVEYLEDEIAGDLCFPSLKTLRVERMINLKGWWREEIGEETQRPRLPKVSKVTIHGCPELKGQMPWMEGVEYLDLEGVDVKFLEELMHVNPKCSSLLSFELKGIKGLFCLPEGWIRHLTALQTLRVVDCEDLKWVSGRGLAHLTALKYLWARYVGDEDEDEDEKTGNEVGMPWKALQGLERLSLGVGNKHLLEGVQYLTRLGTLGVLSWKKIGLHSLEFQCNGFKSLCILRIGFDGKTCHLVKYGIQDLHSLVELLITDCKELYLSWKTLLLRMKLKRLILKGVEKLTTMDVEDDVITAVEQQSPLVMLVISERAMEKCVDDIPWNSLSTLHMLGLFGMEEREHLPDRIQHLTSLEALCIIGCEKLRSLPTWIPQLTSLTYLQLCHCPEQLERRCKRGRGEDWPLICHISRIQIFRQSSDEEEEKEEEENGMVWPQDRVK